MTDKKSKEEAIKKQGEAQQKHAGEAPDKHMEAEGVAAQNNPEAGAREVEDWRPPRRALLPVFFPVPVDS